MLKRATVILIERHIIHSIGKASLGKLNVHRIDRFYKALAEKGLGAQSIGCVHLLLRRMLDEAYRTGQIAFNPAALCKLPQGAAHESGKATLHRTENPRRESLNSTGLSYTC